MGSDCFHGSGVSAWGDEDALEQGSGDGGMNSMPLNCILLHGYSYVMRTSPQEKKKKRLV